MYLFLSLRLVNMTECNSNLFLLLSETAESGVLKYYSDERARNYLKAKFTDIIRKDLAMS